jgi:hypothetical protein
MRAYVARRDGLAVHSHVPLAESMFVTAEVP